MNCKFCYLGSLRKKQDLLDLRRLEYVLRNFKLRIVDIYGGEVSLLDKEYVDQLVCGTFCENMYVTTNSIGFMQSRWMEYVAYNEVDVSFSYDINRPKAAEIRKNIKNFDEMGIKYAIICTDQAEIDIEFLSSLKNMDALSIKPISVSKYMSNKAKFDSYMFDSYKKLYEFQDMFQKIEKITDFRDAIPHYFLLPDGKLYDIQYKNGKEFFCEIQKCQKNISDNCLSCKYYRHCFNEHYMSYVVPTDGECLGRKATMEFLDGVREDSLHKAY